jgi:hypothetical protein
MPDHNAGRTSSFAEVGVRRVAELPVGCHRLGIQPRAAVWSVKAGMRSAGLMCIRIAVTCWGTRVADDAYVHVSKVLSGR